MCVCEVHPCVHGGICKTKQCGGKPGQSPLYSRGRLHVFNMCWYSVIYHHVTQHQGHHQAEGKTDKLTVVNFNLSQYLTQSVVFLKLWNHNNIIWLWISPLFYLLPLTILRLFLIINSPMRNLLWGLSSSSSSFSSSLPLFYPSILLFCFPSLLPHFLILPSSCLSALFYRASCPCVFAHLWFFMRWDMGQEIWDNHNCSLCLLTLHKPMDWFWFDLQPSS